MEVHDEVRARRFVLEDAHGNARGAFTTVDGTPILELNDTLGHPRVTISVPAEGAAIRLHNENGEPQAVFRIIEGAPAIVMCDSDGDPLLSLEVREDRYAMFIYDKKHARRLQVGFDVLEDAPGVALLDEHGVPMAMLVAQAEGGALALFDAERKTTFTRGAGWPAIPYRFISRFTCERIRGS